MQLWSLEKEDKPHFFFKYGFFFLFLLSVLFLIFVIYFLNFLNIILMYFPILFHV
jgi:hypothetical protein